MHVKAPPPGGGKNDAMDLVYRRGMNLLALAAMLMLSLLPALGRHWTADAGATAQVAPSHGCHAPREDVAPDVSRGADCGYCTLLAGTALPEVPRPAAPPAWRVLPIRASAGLPPVQDLSGSGLGARGPPATA